MNIDLIAVVTFFVTLILGYISKRSTFVNNNLIPLQNLFIGIIVALIDWLITKDFSNAIALSGIIAGGTYDIFHNINKILKISDENG